MVTKLSKSEKYQTACFSYGIITLLLLIEEYEKEENYEECAIIYDAIRELNNKPIWSNPLNLPTKMSDNAWKYYLSQFKENSIIKNNKPSQLGHFKYYASIVKKEIK